MGVKISKLCLYNFDLSHQTCPTVIDLSSVNTPIAPVSVSSLLEAIPPNRTFSL
jgi:hypothetical protein